MLVKRLCFLFGFALLFIFTGSKIEALNNISYCTYNDDLSLLLPVNIGVDINGINLHYPFSSNLNIHQNIEVLIYDEISCEKKLDLPYFDEKTYLIGYKYYYKYNDTITYVESLNNPTYTIKDVVPPSISSYKDYIYVNNDEKLELDKISSFITSHDDIDGDISAEIIFDNYSDNYNKVGTYDIIFKACDKSNNCSSLNQKIIVRDLLPPIIEGPNYISSTLSSPITIQEIVNTLVAHDNHDGIISGKIYLVDTNFNPLLPDVYYASFSVKDSSNNTLITPFQVKIQIIDDILPTIEGANNIISKLSSPLSTENILNSLVINDNIDSLAYKNLYIIDDNYSLNKDKVGEYQLVLGTYDSSGNESIPFPVSIKVIDDVAPVISGENLYESYLSAPISITKIKSSLIAIDNHDGNIINKIEISEDTYSNNKDNRGIYDLFFIVKDSSSNVSSPHHVQIIVYDDIAPIIEGNNYYQTLNTIKLDIQSIKLSLTAHDNVDGDLSQHIELNEDTYSDNFSNIGTYFLTYYVSDKSGNLSIPFKIKILVNEDLSYIQKLNNTIIYISTNSYKDSTSLLTLIGIDSIDFKSITTLEDTYSSNYMNQGKYIVKFELQNKDYTKEYLTINIHTYKEIENAENSPTSYKKEERKKETIFSKIISFFKSLFNKIKTFFKNLFS